MTPKIKNKLLHTVCLFIIGICGFAHADPIHLGIDVLEQSNFRAIEGKRVGLLTHPAGVNRKGVSTIEVLHRASNVRLVALFGPEHGIYGDEKANQPVLDRKDARTGLPVYSLYGQYRKPTQAMLEDLDVLVIDLQDIGVRSYTYISSMRYAMEACFENGVECIVLDRPNPLGGLKVDGPPLDRELKSFVGAFPVPYVHGLTIGELARIARHRRGWLDISDSVRRSGKLKVVPMRGWRRDMLWSETGLPWTPTSPYIADLSAVLGYAMTGLGAQEGGFSHGIGTPYPFRLLRHKGKSATEVRDALRERDIAGVRFHVKQARTTGGQKVEGVYVQLSDWSAFRPTELSFHMMALTAAWTPGNPFQEAGNADLFNKHVGSGDWWKEIRTRGEKARVDAFVRHWASQARAFQKMARNYWMYPAGR
ncbi:MAG: DUF1343 domain-containing protein [Opitutales bacterium]